MTEREKILARIREALTVQAPLSEEHNGNGEHAPPAASSLAGTRQWLPAVGNSFKEQLAAFRQNAESLKADVFTPANRDELKKRLFEVRCQGRWTKIASHAGELTDWVLPVLGLPVLKTDSGFDASDLEQCDAGVTECDALIAQTGSVLVTSSSAGGRLLSVLPPHHVVLARREQLLPDLPAAFELLKQKYGASYPSMISFITGPSRTGDIERILVLGAHGPKKLTIFLI